MEELIKQWINEAIEEFDKAEMYDDFSFSIPDNCYERAMQLLKCVTDLLGGNYDNN